MKPIVLPALLCVLVSACSEKKDTGAKELEIEILDHYDRDDVRTRDENHPDAKVIQQLRAAGSNLAKPHRPDFQFDFPERNDAEAVARKLQADGFSCKIHPVPEDPPIFELIAQKEMLIEFTTMADLTDSLRALAEEHHGELTGWGTSVEE